MEQEEKTSNSNTKMYGIFAVAVITLLVLGIVVINPLSKKDQSSTSETQAEMQPQTTVTQMPSSISPTDSENQDMEYKDGEYTVVGEYQSPGGSEEIGVTLTLEDNVITEASVEVMAERPISVEKQTDFSENFQELVVGKPINEVMLTKVSGASLTPQGFNDAVQKIRQQASS